MMSNFGAVWRLCRIGKQSYCKEPTGRSRHVCSPPAFERSPREADPELVGEPSSERTAELLRELLAGC
jgi:hypothetical protein